MKTPYDIDAVAQTYRAERIRTEGYVDTYFNLVALNVNWQLARGAPVAALDVGCGAGGGFKVLTDKLVKGAGALSYFGIDESARQIELAQADHKESGRVRFRQGPADALPFDAASFDTVFECRLFQFLQRPLQTLDEMARVSRELLIATVFTFDRRLDCFHPFFTRFDLDDRHRITAGGQALKELRQSELIGHLLMRDGRTNHYEYVFAKQKRTLPAHDELDAFIARFPGRLMYRNVVAQALETVIGDGGETGPTTAADRLERPIVRWQTIVLRKH